VQQSDQCMVRMGFIAGRSAVVGEAVFCRMQRDLRHRLVVLTVALTAAFAAGCQNGVLPERDMLSTGEDNDAEISERASTAVTRSERILAELNDETAGTVMIVAHRGCWADAAPENSLAAIRRCEAIGADIIEIDVGITSDGTPVLMHDDSVDRTTDGSGAIAGLPLEQVRNLRLRSGLGGSSAELTDERVPTLEEALAFSSGRFLVNLDMKAEAFDRAYEVVEMLGMENQTLMKMSALPDDPVLQSASFLGETLFMPIIRECTVQNEGMACTDSISSIVQGYSQFDPIAYEVVYSTGDFLREGIATMRAMGGRIWVNTLEPTLAAGHTDALAITDPDAHWGQVIRDGANIIQTDRPALLLDYLRRQRLRSN